MKKAILILSVVCLGYAATAQDSVRVDRKEDTIRIGGMIILKKGGSQDDEKKRVVVTIGNRSKERKNSNITTSTWVFDLGFANWTDRTNYAEAIAHNNLMGTPDLAQNDFKLKTGKSINVNLWFVMQRVNLVQHVLNLRYGLGLELNNYRFKSQSPLSFSEGGANPFNTSQNIPHAFVFRDSIKFTKNKLAADYLTVPLMLDIRTKGNGRSEFSISGGVSIGYLYSSRNKQISDERGKQKNRGDYDLEKWKFSYIGEVGLGPIHLYGSYSPKSIFTNDLNFTPYNVGLRLINK